MTYDLTVILAIYNMENHIERCLNSVLAQGNLTDVKLRLICVNDGSTDGTVPIIERYAAEHPWIELHTKDNGGVSSARNFGLDLVEDSTYVTFLDPDDTWAPHYLQRIAEGMATGADSIFFDINLVDASRNLVKALQICPDHTALNQAQLIRRLTLSKPASWTRVHKTELYEGNRFPLGRIYEDLALMPYITSLSTSVHYIHDYIYNYVIDVKNSIMNSRSSIFDIYSAFDYLFEKFGPRVADYREELHYLMLEHLAVGQSYRLIGYSDATRADYDLIVDTLRHRFGKNWNKNTYISSGVQKNNINSVLGAYIPQFLLALKLGLVRYAVYPAKIMRQVRS